MQFVRFVCGECIEDVGYRAGFLHAAYQLRIAEDVPEYVQEQLSDAIDWFKLNLVVPGKFNCSSSKGFVRRNAHGLSWFKATAADHIGRARDIMAILEANGIDCEAIRTDRIGYVIYEDEYQVVAEPFKDTPT